MNELDRWLSEVKRSLEKGEFIKLILSKPAKDKDLINLYVKQVTIKEGTMLSLTYRHKTRDLIKNYSFEDGLTMVRELLDLEFKIGTLLTTHEDLVLRIFRKGKKSLTSSKPSQLEIPTASHDQPKKKRANAAENYLLHLGVTDKEGMVIPKMADKYKQINKYLEIMEEQIKSIDLSSLNIVDMGAGKGYLTFALYDYLNNKLKINARVIGVEQRKDLVDKCNAIARNNGFENLYFESSSIENFNMKEVDILIALHACDTATDDAIAKGIAAQAKLIVCAPCCHKQIRQQLKGKEQSNPMLKYGIFKEREYEMVTDTIRALLLEKKNYKSNIFEFISNEHTRKNTMLIGVKSKPNNSDEAIQNKIDSIKKEYQIDFHYLEKLIA